ncbi:Permease of the drug/metabolite transporter (DMT) superfamily [hydrothermal vent metagenome]|uniref:Permease of the drug/metabolite transporter (DMT) superfamily n=1 Tax=hydrothermal vent metagenome TaxID=652676 RepID=A0A3B0RU56_9ZZZZ
MNGEETQEPSLLTPRILIPFLLVSLIWGSTWLIIKDQIGTVPPSWSVAYRFLIAAAAMFVLVAIRKQPFRLGRQGQLWAILIGTAQFSFNFIFVYNAELYITSGLVAVMFALLMVPNAIMGKYFLGQPIGGAFVAGSAIAAAGIAMLFWQEYKASTATLEHVLLGVVFTVGGILSASAANVMQATARVKIYPILTMLAWAMLWGAAINIVVSLVTAGPPQYELRAGYWAGIFYLGVIGSVVTFPLYFALIREIGPGKAAYSSVLVPVVAMILSTLFEGYVWTALSVGGAILAMLGLIVALRARKPKVR